MTDPTNHTIVMKYPDVDTSKFKTNTNNVILVDNDTIKSDAENKYKNYKIIYENLGHPTETHEKMQQIQKKINEIDQYRKILGIMNKYARHNVIHKYDGTTPTSQMHSVQQSSVFNPATVTYYGNDENLLQFLKRNGFPNCLLLQTQTKTQ